MATITIKIPTIEGASIMAGHEKELDAVAVRDLISAPYRSSSAGLSEIAVTRLRDQASPKLAQACSVGENLGEVIVSMFRNTENGPKPFMQYTLSETFVSRIEHETAEANGSAYLPHGGFSGLAGHRYGALWRAAGSSQNADRPYSRARANPNPIFPMPLAPDTDNEVERVWFSPSQIVWTYTPYDSNGVAGGAIAKGWDLQRKEAI